MELLLQNLRLRQSELATQNEALRRSQAVLKESCDRYRHLYEFAPVGYLTLTDVGRIAEINLAAAMILKEDRGRLLHSVSRTLSRSGTRSAGRIISPCISAWR